MEEGITVSSDDVIKAYREKMDEVMYENAILKAQIARLLRERPDQEGHAALQAGR